MKLELSGGIHPPIDTRPTTPPSPIGDQASVTSAPVPPPVDRTTFQSGPASVKALATNALASPEIRQDKVDTIRQSIASGTYQFNAGKVADAMISSTDQR